MQLEGIRAVIFDKDGTLIDVEATWGPSMAAAVRAVVDDEKTQRGVADAIGLDLERETLIPDGPIIAESNDELCERMAPILGADPDELLEEFERHLYAHARTCVAPLPGVREVLDALVQAGIWIGLAPTTVSNQRGTSWRSLAGSTRSIRSSVTTADSAPNQDPAWYWPASNELVCSRTRL